MNQLCRVCGEPAAGFHFGAFTCEGCKSFFGRTYNNLSSISECKNGNQCVINKKNRTSCKACRLRKCLVVGMSKSGSRYGRRSNWFKIHCLLQEQSNNNNNIQQSNVKTIESWSDKNSSQSPPIVSSESINSPSEIHRNFSPDIRNLPQLRNIEDLRNLPQLRSLELPNLRNIEELRNLPQLRGLELHNLPHLHNIEELRVLPSQLELRKYEETRNNLPSKLNKLPTEFNNLPKNLSLHNLPLELRNYLSKMSELQNISTQICNLSETRNITLEKNTELHENKLELPNYEKQLSEQEKSVENKTKCTRNITPNTSIWYHSNPFLTSPFLSSNPTFIFPQNNKEIPKEELSGLELLKTLGPVQELPMDLSIKNKSSVNCENVKNIVKCEFISEKSGSQNSINSD